MSGSSVVPTVELTVKLPDEAATARLGAVLAALLVPSDFVALRGDLGAGKTALARAVIRARLGDPGEEVPSPTFTLVQTYEAPDILLTHVDLYRIEQPEDAAELGLADALDEGALLVEWPEKLGLLPQDRLDIAIHLVGEGGGREARLAGQGSWASRVEGLKDA
ncbi:tRNA (adenosine(37)-N6)-threonylcarbamoyltransferase complex ATPase subunit type 1 TsaE [Parvibaculum sp.]|uniref:tRNA (adenosine(37)-N6)-threonylcarbamoyltransferase complex ATPase subunit type 1 TsaE n=1 Tax=Parvibaculum sp. TaxID=2024848 RepID=UPI002BC38BDD|nr:tRNA (adenosine(37)-N6)-threonylcarbamoyltransferase complex ATPase subunit type 1 TsaE [Parvibaculum sp.]HUD50208.1 tRNA (adenosine(37)-N6)-threonylcarbamoyltransferase complex ATPase subunit type 1 TsaE [Parvibaculum sp.]